MVVSDGSLLNHKHSRYTRSSQNVRAAQQLLTVSETNTAAQGISGFLQDLRDRNDPRVGQLAAGASSTHLHGKQSSLELLTPAYSLPSGAVPSELDSEQEPMHRGLCSPSFGLPSQEGFTSSLGAMDMPGSQSPVRSTSSFMILVLVYGCYYTCSMKPRKLLEGFHMVVSRRTCLMPIEVIFVGCCLQLSSTVRVWKVHVRCWCSRLENLNPKELLVLDDVLQCLLKTPLYLL